MDVLGLELGYGNMESFYFCVMGSLMMIVSEDVEGKTQMTNILYVLPSFQLLNYLYTHDM